MKRRRQLYREETAKKEPVAPSTVERQHFQLFPGYSLHVVMFVVVLGRLSYVTDPASSWILHPDEIFQVTEVAHSDVYGYGFQSAGYQLPHLLESGMDRPKEAMRGIHSWILPKFYSWSLVFKESMGIPTQPYLFMKQLHVTVSSLLPLFVFFFSRALHPDWPTDVATIAALIIGFTDYFVLLGTHTLQQSFLSPALFGATCLMYRREKSALSLDRNDNYAVVDVKPASVERFNGLVLLCAGLIHAIVCYIKPDTVLFVFVLQIFLFSESKIKNKNLFGCYVLGLILGLTCGGYYDYVQYGVFFSSPFRWVKFELMHAGSVYGTSDVYYYFENLFFNPNSTAVFCLSSIIVTILYTSISVGLMPGFRELRLWASENRESAVISSKLFLCATVLLTLHSFQPHKDMRYIHDILVLFGCSGAAALFCLYQLVRVFSATQNQEKLVLALKLFVYAEAVLYALRACSPVAMKSRFVGMSEMVIPGTVDNWHVNRCLDFVSRQTDVTGVLLDHPIHLSAGYTAIHRNVPLIAKTHFDFREWNMESRSNFTSRTSLCSNQSLSSFDRISNYIAQENGKLVLKIVSQQGSPYNYIVLTNNRRFPKQSYREIFRSGNVTVSRKIKSRAASEHLAGLNRDIPVGKDANVLKVEASWLMAFNSGLASVARQRLERALHLDPNCLGCWQLLHEALLELELHDEARTAAKECAKVLGPEMCASKTRIAPLHPGYSFGISSPRQPKPILM